MDLSIHVVIMAILAFGVVGLVVYKKSMAGASEEEHLDLHNLEANAVAQHAAVSEKVEKIDRLMLILIAFLILYGAAIGGVLLYNEWTAPVTTEAP